MNTNTNEFTPNDNNKMLRASSIPNEYYLGDKPGTLQYKKEADDIICAVRDSRIENQNNRGYVLCEHTLEYIKSVTPKTKTAKEGDWQVILIMKSNENDDGSTWLKCAMKNKKTGKIALMTSTNSKEKLARPIDSLENGWFIGHYRMSAPICFWKELSNRLLYSL
jgi:hypothetical protein